MNLDNAVYDVPDPACVSFKPHESLIYEDIDDDYDKYFDEDYKNVKDDLSEKDDLCKGDISSDASSVSSIKGLKKFEALERRKNKSNICNDDEGPRYVTSDVQRRPKLPQWRSDNSKKDTVYESIHVIEDNEDDEKVVWRKSKAEAVPEPFDHIDDNFYNECKRRRLKNKSRFCILLVLVIFVVILCIVIPVVIVMDKLWKGCGHPGVPMNSNLYGGSYTTGSTVNYTCNGGYRLMGNEYRTCLKNKTWNGTQPRCEDIDECFFTPNICKSGDKCINMPGSYICGCPSGFNLSSNKKDCVDVDECLTQKIKCGINAYCRNTPGSFKCDCINGFHPNESICIDINECESKPSKCHPMTTCLNTAGSYKCTCKSGYRGDGIKCTDINECEAKLSPCNPMAICSNTAGSYKCTCKTGFLGDGIVCADINECKLFPRDNYNRNDLIVPPCNVNSMCINTVGSYVCECKIGYLGDGFTCQDVDECKSVNSCKTKCINTVGSYSCDCPPGYYLSFDDKCLDMDECESSNACGGNGVCRNTIGSYSCNCLLGFRNEGPSCVDFDECRSNPCEENTICTNTIGSYLCSCKPGFDDRNDKCIDIDECLNDNKCGVNALCSNTPGSYSCICKSGFNGDGLQCTDVDECRDNPCIENSICTNTFGSYMCSCKPGFNVLNNRCTDIDECSLANKCSVNAICTNNPGSYTCICKGGFSENGAQCTDIDECKTELANQCGKNSVCINTIGTYMCNCKEGYSKINRVCSDIDECRTRNQCHRNGICINTIGSYLCTCDIGFTGNGINCSDLDECAFTNTNKCDENAICSNSVGSYSCRCRSGFTGNGFTCSGSDTFLIMSGLGSYSNKKNTVTALSISKSIDCRFPSLPEHRRSASAGVLGNELYFCGGGKGGRNSRSKECWSLDMSSSQSVWKPSVPLPKVISSAASAVKDETLYILGGDTNVNRLANVYSFKRDYKEWKDEVNLSRARSGACAVTIGDYIIITGGEPTTTMTEMSTMGNLGWQRLPEMKEIRSRHACIVINIAGTLYILVAGSWVQRADRTGSRTSEMISWSNLNAGWIKMNSNLAYRREHRPILTLIDGYILLIGGNYDTEEIEEFDPISRKWRIMRDSNSIFNEARVYASYAQISSASVDFCR